MTQIDKIRKKSGGYIPYKFYGVEDMSAGFDVKFLIENYDLLKDTFAIAPRGSAMAHLDELRLFFLAKKIRDMEKIVPYVKTDENRTIVKDLVSTCRKYCNEIGVGAAIKYINRNFKRILSRKKRAEHMLIDVVLDFVFEYNTGIKKPVWIFLADEYSHHLLNEYAKIKKVLLHKGYGPDMLDRMIKINNPTDLIKYHLDAVFGVLSDITLNHGTSNLSQIAELKTNRIYDIINNLRADDITERDLLIMDSIYQELLSYLGKIKDKRANTFSKKVEWLNGKLDNWLKVNGETFSCEIPVDEIVNMWRKDKHWELRLLSLTHGFSRDESGSAKVFSRLDNCEKPGFVSDHCNANMSTDRYFTCSRQLTLQTHSAVGGGTILAILRKDNDAEEYYKLISSAIYHIQKHSKSKRAESLSADLDILIGNVEVIRRNNNEIDTRPFYYGAAMMACALSEKILKTVYEDSVMEEQYIATDSLELKGLLAPDDKNNPLIPIFGASHLRHLAFFLCKSGDNRVGYGVRNSLAHLSDSIEDKLGEPLLLQLLWIFTDILNTAFWHYISEA